MKLLLLLVFGLTLSVYSIAQSDPIVAANKCYDDKNYECAVGKYQEALADKRFQEKDLATIKYRIGFGLKEQKKFTEAIPALKEAIAANYAYGDAQWTLGWCYYSTQQYYSAVENYRKAMPFYKDDKKTLGSLNYGSGISNMGLKEYEDALEDFESAISYDTTVSNYFSYAGEAAYNLGEYTSAVNYYQRAINVGSADNKVTAARYYWVGQGHLELKKYTEAHAAFQKGLSFNPENKSIHWGIAATYFNEKKWEDALKFYTKSMPYYKDDTSSTKELSYWRGRVYKELKDYDKAIADYDATLKIDPQYREAFRQKAAALYYQKKYKEAIPVYTKSIVAFDNDKNSLDDLYYFRGYCILQTKDTVNAEKDFKQSLQLNSNLRDPNIFMGHLNYIRGKYSDARLHYNKGADGYTSDTADLAVIWARKGISNYLSGDAYLYTAKEDLLKAIKYDPNNKEAHRYVADVYYRQSNFTAAEKELTTCIDLYKKNKDSLARMYLYRGFARYQLKNYKDALTDYEQSDKLQTLTNAPDVLAIGQLSFEVKEYDKSTKAFTRLISMYKPTQKDELLFAYFGRGRSALELKNKTAAVADLKKALEFNPSNQEVQNWLKKAEELN